MMMMMMTTTMTCVLPVINMRGVQDIRMEGREEVSHDMTWIPSFAGNFCFTSVCVYTSRNDFHCVSACSDTEFPSLSRCVSFLALL